MSLEPWRALLTYPGFSGSLWMSLWTGFAATVISFAIAIGFAAAWRGTRVFGLLQRLVAPLLSVPHAAVALGMLFLLAPSGWVLRMGSPWATGFTRPPDWATAPDPYGLVFVLALVVKETPFLFLMTVAALNQVREREIVTTARTLGYGPTTAWLKCVFPLVYPQLRLPVYAVLAFSLSVIDVALVLAPATSPPLGVLILRWFNDPDLSYQFVAAAGAVAQLVVVAGGIAIWRLGEWFVAALGRRWASAGDRDAFDRPVSVFSFAGTGLLWVSGAGSLLGMAIWSMARQWRFPDALPSEWSLANWMRRADTMIELGGTTVTVGLASAGIALFLAVACLEHEKRDGLRPTARALWLLYTPLLVPQVAFLFGAQVLLVAAGIDGGWTALIWAHLLFVLPYVFLSLSDPFRSLDERYRTTAQCLGLRPAAVFWRVTAPLLLRPILVAFAVGFAVSVSQYLPTVFAGGGRLETLTTEAVALAGGGDRRLIGMLVFAQSILPFLAFLFAAGLPAWAFRNRLGLRGLA
ncbi:ABC transporter permease [Hwanghaeella sp.]|uniref:ABC transporter permease n=1 Tax=Hwanghaeella sp. TaxID=2605943 RepID=UPI003CCBED4A